jgi:hypothetical protein
MIWHVFWESVAEVIPFLVCRGDIRELAAMPGAAQKPRA